jgi:hypothetical protein
MFLAPSSERRGGRPTDQRQPLTRSLREGYGPPYEPVPETRSCRRGLWFRPRLQEGCQAIVNSPEIFRDSARISHSNTQKTYSARPFSAQSGLAEDKKELARTPIRHAECAAHCLADSLLTTGSRLMVRDLRKFSRRPRPTDSVEVHGGRASSQRTNNRRERAVKRSAHRQRRAKTQLRQSASRSSHVRGGECDESLVVRRTHRSGSKQPSLARRANESIRGFAGSRRRKRGRRSF